MALFKIRVVKPDPGTVPSPGGIQLNIRETTPSGEPTAWPDPAAPDPTGPDQPGVLFQGTPGQLISRTVEDLGFRPGSVQWYLFAPRHRFVAGWLVILTGALVAVALGPVWGLRLPALAVVVVILAAVLGWAAAIMYYRSALADARAGRLLSGRTAVWLAAELVIVVALIVTWLLVLRG